VKNLRESNIRTSFDGSLWIMGKREKTGINFNIPLLDIPKIILEKYKRTLPNGYVLPVISNQNIAFALTFNNYQINYIEVL
jgi:hypothetical protein